MIDTKLCYDCDQQLPLTSFVKNRRMKDGLSLYCRRCMRLRQLHLNPPRPHRASVRVQERIATDRKLCRSCGQVKVLSRDFYPTRHMSDGYTSFCKPCHQAEKQKTLKPDTARLWREKNRARLNEYSRQYRLRRKQLYDLK